MIVALAGCAGSAAVTAAPFRVLELVVLAGLDICRKQNEQDHWVQVADLSELAFAESMRDAGVVSVDQLSRLIVHSNCLDYRLKCTEAATVGAKNWT